MKSNLLFTLLAACLLAFTACQTSSETKPDMAQIKSEIQQVENAWADALNTRNLDALMALYAGGAVSMTNEGPTLTGKDAIRKHQEEEWKSSPPAGTYSFETLDVYGDGEVVTEVGTTTMKDAAGRITGTSKYMAVFEKQNGKFLCTREIYNNDQATPAVAASKSIHLFDLPADMTEAEWSAALKDMNSAIAKMGYPDAGYFLYKTEDPGTNDYRYYFEGVWPSAGAYAKIHEDPAYLAASEKLGPLYDKIKAVEIYRRGSRVE
jgi:uncharacterized protein (TIGR02246 family)